MSFLLLRSTVTAGAEGGEGDAREDLVVLDDFATLRTANNGADQYFNYYNGGGAGDSGPDQTSLGVSGNIWSVDCPEDNIWFVDFDCASYTQASHWMRNHIKSGTWDQSINRLTFLFRPTRSNSRNPNGSDNFNFGTYIKPIDNFSPGAEGTDPSDGQHFYHGCGLNIYANRWVKMVMTDCPQHERGDDGSIDQNPITDYYHKMTRGYFTYWGGFEGAAASVWDLAAVELFRIDDSDDVNIRSLSIQYTGTQYEVTFAARKGVSQTFDIRYRLDGQSMKANGFTSGTSGSTVSNPGDDYTGCFWQSGAMSESEDGIYVAIRLQGETPFSEIYLPYQVGPTNTAVPAAGVS